MTDGMTEEEWADLLYGDRADEAEVDAAIEAGENPPASNMAHASWHWRQAQIEIAQAERIGEVFEAEIERLQRRMSEVLTPIAKREGWHARAVEQWHRAAHAAGEVGKTVKFSAGGSSELRAQQPAQVGDRDDDELRAYLEGREAEGGGTWAERVYKPQEPKFMVSELKKLAKVPKAEPNTPVRLVDPDTGDVIPGIQFVAQGDRWQRGNR